MLLATLEQALNRNIARSAAAQRLCQQLEGKSLCLELTGLPTPFVLRAAQGQLTLSAQQVDADATLSGSPLGLLALARNSSTSLGGRNVRIAGDAEVAQRFSELLKHCKPDAEEELSRLIGDVAAHQVGVTVRHLAEFGKRTLNTFTDNVGEYLKEESRDVPHPFEVDDFVRQVDTLRDDVERIAARLTLLEQKKQ